MIKIDSAKCLRCGACVRDCIVEVLKTGPDGVPYLPQELEKSCINCQHCLAVCPAGALTCRGVTPESCASCGELPQEEQMLNLIRQRRSIRQYKQEALDAATLRKLEDSLAWSPTGCNARGLVFRVVGKTDMDFFREESTRMMKFLIRTGIMTIVYPKYKRYLEEIVRGKDVIFRNAPHLIVAAAAKKAPCGEADPWIALTQFDLYAQTLGIGTCWCGFAMYAFRFNKRMRERLALPEGYRLSACMLFGRPAVQYARATRPAPYNQ